MAARRLGKESMDRSSLRAYVVLRHRHRERLTLRSIETTDHSRGNFRLVLVRRADDYPVRTIEGKGAVDCSGTNPHVIVWSLGG